MKDSKELREAIEEIRTGLERFFKELQRLDKHD